MDDRLHAATGTKAKQDAPIVIRMRSLRRRRPRPAPLPRPRLLTLPTLVALFTMVTLPTIAPIGRAASNQPSPSTPFSHPHPSSASAATISLILGPPSALRDATHGSDQPARVIPDTIISATGPSSPYGMVANFVRDPATGITQLRTGYAPLGGGAFSFDHNLDTTTRDDDDLGVGRPDAIVDPSTGHALFAYILSIRGRHDVLFGQLASPLAPEPAFSRRWLNRTDLRTPQQLAFARPADIGASHQLLGFTAFRTDASAGSNVYIARLNPIDLSSEIANVTPAEFRNCTDIRIFHAAIGPVAAARCRRTESTLWRAVVFKLSGVEPWSGSARLVDPVIIGPDDDAEDLRVLDAAMDPKGVEITLAWAASAAPASPELKWESRRFDLGTWTPTGEAEPFGGDGVSARVSYIDLARQGWSEMRAILDVALDGDVTRGRVSLTGRLNADETGV